MRTTIAASPPRLHWQAAFTTKTYKPQTSSLVVWQHVFVSDTPMTNWGGSSLLLTWVVKRHPPAQNVVRATDALHHELSNGAAAQLATRHVCELVGALSLAFPSNPFAGKRYLAACG